MDVLSEKLTRHIKWLKAYHASAQKGAHFYLSQFVKKTLREQYIDKAFWDEFSSAMRFHITGDVFSENTITALHKVFNSYYRSTALSPILNLLINQTKPFVDALFSQVEKEIKLEKMQVSYEPLSLHVKNLQQQLRQLIKENMELVKHNEQLKSSLKQQKSANAQIELKHGALAQEVKVLRGQNKSLSRLIRIFRAYLGKILKSIAPGLLEKLKQLYLFKDEPSSFAELSKDIEQGLEHVLGRIRMEKNMMEHEVIDVQAEQVQDGQQSLLEALGTTWNDILKLAKDEDAFCAIITMIRSMYRQPERGFDLTLLYERSLMLENRYLVLKRGLYKDCQSAEFSSKPFFSTQDAVGVVESSLIESDRNQQAKQYVSTYEQTYPEGKSQMIQQLDQFFDITKKLLATQQGEALMKPMIAPAA